MLEDPAIVAAIAVGLMFLAAATGAAAALLWILPPEQKIEHVALIETRAALSRLLGFSLLSFFAAGLVELLLRTAAMSDLPLNQAYAEVGTVLLKTHYGHMWLGRYVLLLLAGLVWLLSRRSLTHRGVIALAFAALAAVTLALSTAGHSGDDGVMAASNLANSLHMLGGLLWGGSILATMLLILPRLTREDAPRELAALSSARLSALAAVSLAMVMVAGCYNAWLQVGSWHALRDTTYGQVLLVKLLVVALMAALGALNRYYYVPAMQHYADLAEPKAQFVLKRFLRGGDRWPPKAFLVSLRLEAGLLVAVLLLAALLSQQVPAVHAEHEGMQGHHHPEG